MMDRIFFGLLMLVIVIGMPFVMIADHEERQRWDDFKATNDCKATARIEGQSHSTIGISTTGSVVYGVTTTPDQTGWTCNDGVTYVK